jgi:glycosyltransferase involved in cell wall biosynthesis
MSNVPSNAPLVSVCIPTYNQARYLAKAVGSVLEQTCPEFEVIIQDDCSTDDTPAVARRFCDDGRVTYRRNPRNLGQFPCMNLAASAARGKYVKILCSDDWLLPDYLSRGIRLLEQSPRVAFVTIDQFSAGEDSDDAYPLPSRIGRHFTADCIVPGRDVLRHYPRLGNFFGGNSDCIMRRDAFEAVGGYDTRYQFYGDEDLFLRLAGVGDVGVIVERLFVGRLHPHSISSTFPMHLKVRERFHLLDQHFRGYPPVRVRLRGELAGQAAGVAIKRVLSRRLGEAADLYHSLQGTVPWPGVVCGLARESLRRWRGAR